MSIKARPLNFEEQLSLILWQQADNLSAYIIARVLYMSQKDWQIPEIALALQLSEGEVIKTIQTFNDSGLENLIPHPSEIFVSQGQFLTSSF